MLLLHWPLGLRCWALGSKDHSPVYLQVLWTTLFLLVRSVLHWPGQTGCWSITLFHRGTAKSPLILGSSASWERWGFLCLEPSWEVSTHHRQISSDHLLRRGLQGYVYGCGHLLPGGSGALLEPSHLPWAGSSRTSCWWHSGRAAQCAFEMFAELTFFFYFYHLLLVLWHG